MIKDALLISLKVSVVSIILSTLIGVTLARVFYKKHSKLKNIIDNILLIPIFLPPSIVGYILLISVGRNGIIGRLFYSALGTGIIFTWYAGVLATFIMSLPIIYQNSKAAFSGIEYECEEAAKVDGANRLQIFFRITLPMAFNGLASGIILGFARGFGEFGATLMVAGNIPGKTQTLPMAMYYAVEGGDSSAAVKIFIVVILISIILISAFNHLSVNSYKIK